MKTPKKTNIFKKHSIFKKVKGFIYEPAMKPEDNNAKMWSVFMSNMSTRSRSK